MATKKGIRWLYIRSSWYNIYIWLGSTQRKIRSIVKNINKLKGIRSGEVNGVGNGELKILNLIKRPLKSGVTIILIKLEKPLGSIYALIQKNFAWNLSKDSVESVYVVEKGILDFSPSTILTETVESIVKHSMALQENFIETWLKRGVPKDLKYKYSVSTATWDDSSMAVLIKYVLTN